MLSRIVVRKLQIHRRGCPPGVACWPSVHSLGVVTVLRQHAQYNAVFSKIGASEVCVGEWEGFLATSVALSHFALALVWSW